jgi:hypothetical protein
MFMERNYDPFLGQSQRFPEKCQKCPVGYSQKLCIQQEGILKICDGRFQDLRNPLLRLTPLILKIYDILYFGL